VRRAKRDNMVKSVHNPNIKYDIYKPHLENMQLFLKRCNLLPHDKIFLINSKDFHIKRALLKGG